MANEWFFKWHFIGRDGPIEIDSFDGRKIRYGGIKFDGTARLVYWDTISRYLKIKNGEIFDQLEAELKSYPTTQIEAAISDTKAIVYSFTRNISESALEKDRILRGDGINFPPLDQSKVAHTAIFSVIEQRANALIEFYHIGASISRVKKAEKFLREHKELVALLLLLGGALGTAILQIGKWLWSSP